MRNTPSVSIFIQLFAAIYVAFFGTLALAGPGHDHGNEPPQASTTASPRVTAHSDLFELVGIVQGQQMQVFLDRYASNEPVRDAQIAMELTAGNAPAVKLSAKPQADGSYLVESAAFAGSASLAIAFTVRVGAEADLLAGELLLAQAVVAASAEHAHGGAADWWAHASLGMRGVSIGGVVVLLAALGMVARRLRRPPAALAVVVLASGLVLATLAAPAWAGPGHDHGGDAASAPVGNTPKRMADGSVFLPKPSQRLLGVRTQISEVAEHAPTVELQGRVVADSNGLGRVQATQQGRLEAGPRGLPQAGQVVRKGEVLATVRFTVNALERSAQLSQLAQAQVELQAAQARLRRLEQLEGIVAQKEIDAARVEASVAQQRTVYTAPALNASESLLAPISGVMMSANAAAGQVVDAREVVFEIVDTSRLRVEAQAFDAASGAGTQRAHVVLATGQSMVLQPLGVAPALRDAAKVLLFRPSGALATQLSMHQAVRVLVQSPARATGVSVPTAALTKNPSNQDIVWVHTGPEQFVPRAVRWALLDGATVLVTDGLSKGDRVVTQGSALVNQVR